MTESGDRVERVSGVQLAVASSAGSGLIRPGQSQAVQNPVQVAIPSYAGWFPSHTVGYGSNQDSFLQNQIVHAPQMVYRSHQMYGQHAFHYGAPPPFAPPPSMQPPPLQGHVPLNSLAGSPGVPQAYTQPPPPPPPPSPPPPFSFGQKRPLEQEGHGQGRGRKQQRQKQVKSAVTAAEAVVDVEIYFCDACEKEMKGRTAFDAHCANHVECPKSGCAFKATKKVIAAHFESTHGQYSGNGYMNIEVEGQNFRVLMGTDPKEVTQWRQDRKGKFPTAARTLEKNAAKEALQAAGGLVGAESGGKDKVNGEAATKGNESNGKGGCASTSSSSCRRVCSFFLKGNCRHGDACRFSHNERDAQGRPQGVKKTGGKLYVPPPLAGGARGTLLRTLLKPEIDQEENLVLQCIAFLNKTDFLDEEEAST